MYKVLIVDDEALIRTGLRCIVDWNECGFEICGEASNGEDALAFIKENRPELVLMDIRMPKLPGLEVVRYCHENSLPTRFIIISGYSDFKYAQEAIRYGVENYLTKPIDDEELLATVLKIKTNLDKKNRSSNHLELMKSKAKDAILHDIVLGNISLEKTYNSEDFAELELDANVYQIVLYESFSNQMGTVFYSFADLLKITNHENHTFNHFDEDNKDVILLKGQHALNKFHYFLDHYYDTVPPQKGSPLDTLFLAYGRPVYNLSDVSQSYNDAQTLVRRRFFCIQGQHTLSYEDLPDVNSATLELQPEILQEYADYLVGYLQTFNRRNVAHTLHKLEEYLYNVKNDITEVKLFLADLYLRIKERIRIIYNNSSIPFPTNSSVLDYIEKKFYLYEIIQFLSEQFEMIMNAIGNPSSNNILSDILYYIDHNYQSNIKLETIAPLFGYNSAYLGKIFNKTVGESFNSYVDHMRIELSKELLLNNSLKVYEIAEKVGYSNVDYFHRKFRKYVGESPAEFRKKNGGNDEED